MFAAHRSKWCSNCSLEGAVCLSICSAQNIQAGESSDLWIPLKEIPGAVLSCLGTMERLILKK